MILQLAVTATLLANPLPDSVRTVDPWISPDKAKHFLVAGFVEAGSFAALEAAGTTRSQAFVGAVTLAGVVSLARELHDKRAKNQFSLRDLAWDLAGGAAAFLVLRKTERP